MFQPVFEITPTLTKALMDIEASRQAVMDLPISVEMLSSLRETAKLLSTHYSTQIEGNRLTEEQVREVIQGKARFPNRERDEEEVRCHYLALEYMEMLAKQETTLSEKHIQELHGFVMNGRKKATPYRDGQNVIRNSADRTIVYMPPEAEDVPVLMAEMVAWVNKEIKKAELPAPLIAAIAHYQFATIHPYYDGNGRTARLLATLLLHWEGYGLKGIYSLDAYYAQDLEAYYDALSIGPSHNYYVGRKETSITGFLEYFCLGVADSFAKVRLKAQQAAQKGNIDQSSLLRNLTARQRKALTLFSHSRTITTIELAEQLKLSLRTINVLCKNWLEEGFIEIENPSRKARSYRLAATFEKLL